MKIKYAPTKPIDMPYSALINGIGSVMNLGGTSLNIKMVPSGSMLTDRENFYFDAHAMCQDWKRAADHYGVRIHKVG